MGALGTRKSRYSRLGQGKRQAFVHGFSTSLGAHGLQDAFAEG